MIRFLLTVLIGLAMAASPGPALAVPSMACAMGEAEAGMVVGHEEMRCCTPDCTASAPAAVLPSGNADEGSAPQVGAPALVRGDLVLPSITPGATDPPPRKRLG